MNLDDIKLKLCTISHPLELKMEEIVWLIKRVERYEKALKFYASRDNWVMDSGIYTLVDLDEEEGMADDSPGATAREALKEDA